MCDCKNIIYKKQTFKNGVEHLRIVCKDCDKFLGYKQQEIKEDFVFHFGKYKGQKPKDVPKSYLIWLHNQDIKENLKKYIEKYI